MPGVALAQQTALPLTKALLVDPLLRAGACARSDQLLLPCLKTHATDCACLPLLCPAVPCVALPCRALALLCLVLQCPALLCRGLRLPSRALRCPDFAFTSLKVNILN